jgi:hypothetical protein
MEKELLLLLLWLVLLLLVVGKRMEWRWEMLEGTLKLEKEEEPATRSDEGGEEG